MTQERVKYPSTLHVTIDGAPREEPRTIISPQRPVFPSDIETHETTLEALEGIAGSGVAGGASGSGGGGASGADGDGVGDDRARRLILRKRKPEEACIVPDRILHRIPCGDMGCTRVKFSNSGRFVAAACVSDTINESLSYSLRIFDTDSGSMVTELSGHFGNIYDIDWLYDDSEIVTASKDGTAKVWSLPARCFWKRHKGKSSSGNNAGRKGKRNTNQGDDNEYDREESGEVTPRDGFRWVLGLS